MTAPSKMRRRALRGAPPRISATRTVEVDAEALYGFLADLENHWLLADPFVELVRLDGPRRARDGGEIRITGPLGTLVRRTARTRLETLVPAELIVGTAQVGRRTVAEVSWTLRPQGARTEVELAAMVISAGALDRLLLAVGGRVWLRRCFAATIGRLEERVAAEGAAHRARVPRALAPASEGAPA